MLSQKKILFYFFILSQICLWPALLHLTWPPLLIGSALFLLKLFWGTKPFKRLYFFPIFVMTIYWYWQYFRTFFEIEAALSLLAVLSGLKFLESKNRQELSTVLNILILFICAQVLYSQSLINTILLFSIFIFILVVFFVLEHPVHYLKTLFTTKLSQTFLKYLFLAIPMTIILFLFFPRIEIGFNPKQSTIQTSGFSPKVAPGESAEIKLDSTLAFRAYLETDQEISPMDRYWIGATLYQTDGWHWSPGESFQAPRKDLKTIAAGITYSISLEKLASEYLFLLDFPLGILDLSESVYEDRPETFKMNRVHTKKIRYRAKALLTAEKAISLSEKEKKLSLQFPEKKISQKIYQLAESLRGDSPEKTIDNILNFFKNPAFQYTLKPGQAFSLDEFLFETRLGYCEHFASAFSLLARLNNIPSRVMVGHQGGDYNSLGNFYAIKESAAHAWSEVYLEKKGWVRIDPVEVVAPARLVMGVEEFFLASAEDRMLSLKQLEELAKLKLAVEKAWWQQYWWQTRQYIDLWDSSYQQFLYSFNSEYQQKVANFFKINSTTLFILAILSPFFILLIFFVLLPAYQQRKNFPLEIVLYKKLIKKLEKYDVQKSPAQTPLNLMAIIAKNEKIPSSKKQKYLLFLKLYQETRYAKQNNHEPLIVLKKIARSF